MATTSYPITLIILDGWGYREQTEANAIAAADTPNFDRFWQTSPHTLLKASGLAVGLPEGQMGNSEVGHLNLGAGRIVYQDLCRITNAIKNGNFFKNTVLIQAIDQAVQNDKAVHVFGLLSPGGIHSSDQHIYAVIRMAAKRGAQKIYVHAFLDGRDTPPRSAEEYIQNLEAVLGEVGTGKIVSLVGRFYAMDRDKRWDRIEKAYDLLTQGEAVYHAETAVKGLQVAYAQGEKDEFISPVSIHKTDQKPVTIQEGDSIVFMNFRSDRAREITRTFIEPDFNEFHRKKVIRVGTFVMLTQYDITFQAPIAFPPKKPENTLAEYISKNNLRQLHIAETEKYAHVTFFFNGGVEAPFRGEERTLIPSPLVATYDLRPEMSANEITSRLVEAIYSKNYDLIICNFANPDMVGHTGDFDATVKALECLDDCLLKIVKASKEVESEVIITADHGNAELMFDKDTGQAHTAHTANPVPFIYIGRPVKVTKTDATLCDIAPTILHLMGLPLPKEMTGESIVRLL
jgi:2,3-bisphosphoglycerate-independent phosphoglycerate mutase